MNYCNACASANPPDANFCMKCGRPLQQEQEDIPPAKSRTGGLTTFALSIAGSVLLSFVLMFVFGLPVFILAGFLPLLWFNRKK
ncbi:MAG: zinc ribbon domain-containing protein [Pseudomonadota bacterium]